MKKIRIGLIGAGRIGSMHARHLAYQLPETNLMAISDVVTENAERLAGELQVPKTHGDFRNILDDRTIEAIVICSSTDTHSRIIQEAAESGKHIFCEKPIALSLDETDKALSVVENSGVKLQVGFNRRFDLNFRKIHEVVAAGKIGIPHILRITSRDPQPPSIDYIKVSGGIFVDMTIHDFDMARFLMGCEVEEIYTKANVMVNPEIGEVGDVDTAVITLNFTNGALGVIDNSRKAVYGYDQRAEVFGSEGMIASSNNVVDATVVSNADGVHSALPLYFFMERYSKSYIAEMKAFIDSIQRNTETSVTGIDGRVALAMGYAAYKSYRENRPVRLAEIA